MATTLTVKDLMKTNVGALTPGTTLQEARAKMSDLGVRHLPVIDRERRLVGLVSQRDVAHALDPQIAAQGLRATIATGDIMIKDLVVARPDTPAAFAVQAMLSRKIGSVPVVDETNHLVGIVTETDFLEVAHEALLGVDPAKRGRG
jgi:CBS domain-containing membrane protein